MDQLTNFGDERQTAYCIYCGGVADETREHVPSRVFLDEPYPENLPTIGACLQCNNGFSLDEQYVACLIDCAKAGSADPSAVHREKVRRMLMEIPTLAGKLAQARQVADDSVSFSIESDRVKNVFIKLARGHALFEENEPQFEEPTQCQFGTFESMTEEQRESFEQLPKANGWPEVGSRAMQRLLVTNAGVWSDWIEVQADRYRYTTSYDGCITVRIVFSEYIWCEVKW
jgi:hypothetical protein